MNTTLVHTARAQSLVGPVPPIRQTVAFFRPASCHTATPCTTSHRSSQQQQQRAQSLITFAKGKKGGGAAVEAPAKGGKGGKGGRDDSPPPGDVAKIEKEAKADAEDRMKKAIASLADNFNTIRTGRANPAILDRIMVDFEGMPTPLRSVAAVSVPDSSTLLITPYDPSSLKMIEKAINESDLGINPNNDGEKIRLGLPQLTQDRRKELVKNVGKFGEDTKVAIRNVRKDVMKKIDKFGDAFSKDAKKTLEDAIQKTTDTFVKKVEEMVKAKSDELMKI